MQVFDTCVILTSFPFFLYRCSTRAWYWRHSRFSFACVWHVCNIDVYPVFPMQVFDTCVILTSFPSFLMQVFDTCVILTSFPFSFAGVWHVCDIDVIPVFPMQVLDTCVILTSFPFSFAGVWHVCDIDVVRGGHDLREGDVNVHAAPVRLHPGLHAALAGHQGHQQWVATRPTRLQQTLP